MAAENIVCPSCGFKNSAPLANDRCVSCGAEVAELARSKSMHDELAGRYRQEGFSVVWFVIALAISAILTGAIVVGLPMVIPAFDFEGSAGMLVAVPVWFISGMLVGLISPGKTFIEPVAATLLVALPTALFLFRGQTVKTMPIWMYALMSAVGLLFTLIGAYLGERAQAGPAGARATH